MTIQLELYQLLMLICSVIAAFWALAKMIVRGLERHLVAQDKQMKRLQEDVSNLRVEVARDYVRRDDHVREIGILATKFENLALNVERKVETLARDGLALIQQALKEFRNQ